MWLQVMGYGLTARSDGARNSGDGSDEAMNLDVGNNTRELIGFASIHFARPQPSSRFMHSKTEINNERDKTHHGIYPKLILSNRLILKTTYCTRKTS